MKSVENVSELNVVENVEFIETAVVNDAKNSDSLTVFEEMTWGRAEELRKDGIQVCFDVYESFDYVKNKKGLKAANITKLERVEALVA